MDRAYAKQNKRTTMLLAALVVCAILAVLVSSLPGISVKAEEGPADGLHTAEITFVSKDKKDLSFMYLSGILLNTDIKGAAYDKSSNTLTLNNTELSKGDTHYSLTIANMGEDFKLNIIGQNSLDYLSLESLGYDTGVTITGPGVLDVGYLDISNDGKKMSVTIDNTVNLNIDSKKMGYNSLPAVKVTSKNALTEMESMIKVLGDTKDELVYEESPSVSSYSYESSINKLTVTPTRVVKKDKDGRWAYFVNDKVAVDYSGLAGNIYGLWKVDHGYVDFAFKGLEKGPGGTYMVNDGKVDFGFNGFASNKDGFWFVERGIVQNNYIGPVVINGTTHLVDKGKVQ